MSRGFKEVLIGIFIVLAVAIFIFMTAWFGGRIDFSRERYFKIYFDNISGLKVGDPVEVLGMIKGRVKGMKLENNQVLVTVSLSSDVKLTNDAKFSIRSLSYIGSDKFLFVEPGMGEPVADKTVFYGENESLNLEQTFLKIDNLLDSLKPLRLGGEFNKIKDELLEAVRNLPQAAKPFVTSVSDLTLVLEKISVKFDSLSNLLRKESTVKELLTSKDLYDEILTTNRQLQDLLKDIKDHPQKYIQLRLFK
jgi:phospholipid/cholesterol/gamma-HCH transport system substrate-binding protein